MEGCMNRIAGGLCAAVILVLAGFGWQGCGSEEPPGVERQKGTVTSADGVTIHYATEGAGDPALVFVHGWSCDRSFWDQQARHFKPAHRIVTIDLAGHGESGTQRDAWTIEAFGEDVAAVIRSLDLSKVVLIGHSMGGPVVAEAALLAPERVAGLVGVDNFQETTLPYTDEQISGFIGQFREGFDTRVDGWVRSMFAAGTDSSIVERVASTMSAAPPEIALSAMEQLLLWQAHRGEETLGKLPVALQCINSDRHPTQAEQLAELNPGYKLRIMPGRGHFLQLEDPATFNELLAACIADFRAGE